MRLLARAVVIGLLGFGLLVLLTAVSERIPGSPLAKSMGLVSIALTEKGQSISDRTAASIFQASHWYESTALPALVGILEGLLLGVFRRLRSLEAVAASFIFAALLFVFTGKLPPADLASWLGPVLFLFCLTGGLYLVGNVKRHETAA